jgi:tetratricopeptide (TPR) repeat protein
MVAPESSSPIISVEIDGQPRKMLIDTGGFWSLIDPAIAAGFPTRRSEVTGRLGLDGIELARAVTAPSVQLGPIKAEHVDFFAAPPGYVGVDGTLGANWLKLLDVEIDPVRRTVSFFSQKHCDGQVVHWPHRDVAVLPVRFDRIGSLMTIPVTLDGEEMRATIDTGSSETVLSLRAASRLFGLEPGGPGVEPLGDYRGKGDVIRQVYRHKFKSLELEGIAFKNPSITLAPVYRNGPELILGMHELSGLHLYFAYREGKLYATSARSDIAEQQTAGTTPPGVDPLARTNARDLLQQAQRAAAGNDRSGAEAAIAQAIKIDPTYAPSYLARAWIEYGKQDSTAALADLSKAITLDPELGPAYRLRSMLYLAQGKSSEALNDANQDVALDPRSATALNGRCWIAATLNLLEPALQDCNAALAIAPNNAAILDSRALVHLKAGRLDDAIADYDAALKLAPKLASSLYGRGLARRQKGDSAGSAADIAAASGIDPDIAKHFGK